MIDQKVCVYCHKKRAKYFEGIVTKYVCMNQECLKYEYKENNLHPKIRKVYQAK